MALRYAEDPRDAIRIGRAIGQAIKEDRAARAAGGWDTQEQTRWDSAPAPRLREASEGGFWASNGGNVALAESRDEGLNIDFLDGIFR